MKLRIKGNSIRLRLSKAEVRTFGETGRVEDATMIGPATDNCFKYALQRSETKGELAADFDGVTLTVAVPATLAKTWCDTDETGMQGEQRVGASRLSILVEKDFQCLHKRPGENESDNFPNPAAED